MNHFKSKLRYNFAVQRIVNSEIVIFHLCLNNIKCQKRYSILHSIYPFKLWIFKKKETQNRPPNLPWSKKTKFPSFNNKNQFTLDDEKWFLLSNYSNLCNIITINYIYAVNKSNN